MDEEGFLIIPDKIFRVFYDWILSVGFAVCLKFESQRQDS